MSDDRLPTALWIEAHLRQIDSHAIPYYILNRGNHASGTVMLKLHAPGQGCSVLIQQRDLDGNLGWMNALNQEIVEEAKADDYIRRAVSRDPDLWVIEIEDRERKNPFEGKIL
jgi:hypothetical protein